MVLVAQFYNNTIGTLTVLAFDTALAAYTQSRNEYKAAACKFEVGVIIVPNPQSVLSQNQLYPLTDAAPALTGSMLQVGPPWHATPLASSMPCTGSFWGVLWVKGGRQVAT